jgi:hypothetical protein
MAYAHGDEQQLEGGHRQQREVAVDRRQERVHAPASLLQDVDEVVVEETEVSCGDQQQEEVREQAHSQHRLRAVAPQQLICAGSRRGSARRCGCASVSGRGGDTLRRAGGEGEVTVGGQGACARIEAGDGGQRRVRPAGDHPHLVLPVAELRGEPNREAVGSIADSRRQQIAALQIRGHQPHRLVVDEHLDPDPLEWRSG